MKIAMRTRLLAKPVIKSSSLSVEQSKPDEIVSFNGIIQFANKEVDYGDEQKYCGLKQLVGQQEPFQPDDVQYKGSSSHVVKILPTIAADDPGIEWDATAIIEADDQGDNLQVCHSLLLQSTVNVCIGDLQDSQEEIISMKKIMMLMMILST